MASTETLLMDDSMTIYVASSTYLQIKRKQYQAPFFNRSSGKAAIKTNKIKAHTFA